MYTQNRGSKRFGVPYQREMYVAFNDKSSVNQLDLRTVPDAQATVFPYDLYRGKPFAPFYQSPCPAGQMPGDYPTPRDTRSAYIFGGERTEHPDYTTFFWRAGWPNGYGAGTTTGGWTQPSPYCSTTEPADTAPPGMYVCDAEYTGGTPHRFLSSCAPAPGGSSWRSEAYNMELNGKSILASGKGFCSAGKLKF